MRIAPGCLMGAVILLAGCAPEQHAGALGDPRRGAAVILRGACGSCHAIPGIPLADGVAGPSLAGFGARATIAGVLANTPEHLVDWLRDPQRYVPGGAMPTEVRSEQDTRDAAAYLQTLRSSG